MLQHVLRCFADVLAPVAQGAMEMAKGQAVGMVIRTIEDHFQTSEVLPRALEESFVKGIDTLEIALAGPSFYHKTANKEFAERFREEILLPLFQEKGID